VIRSGCLGEEPSRGFFYSSTRVAVYAPGPDVWSVGPSMLEGRENHCAVVVRGVMYVLGGYNRGTNKFLRSVEAYVNGSWIAQPNMLFAHSDAACGVVQNTIVVAGGQNEAGVIRLVEAFVDGAWVRRADSRYPLTLASSATMVDIAEQREKLFLAGGSSSVDTDPYGRETWSTSFATRSPELSSDNKYVYFVANNATLFAYTASGQESWSFPMLLGAYFNMLRPAVSNSKVYASSGPLMYAFDAKSGARQWVVDTKDTLYNPVVSADKAVYIGAIQNTMIAINAQTGTVLWRFGPSMGRLTPVVSADNTLVFCASCSNMKLYAVDTTTGKQKWVYSTSGTWIESNPALSPDSTVVYIGANASGLHAVYASTGIRKWLMSSKGTVGNPGVSPDGKIVYVLIDRELIALDATTGAQKWKYEFAYSSTSLRWTAPIISANFVCVGYGTTLYVFSIALDFLWTGDYGDSGDRTPAISSSNMLYVGGNKLTAYQLPHVDFSSEVNSFFPEISPHASKRNSPLAAIL